MYEHESTVNILATYAHGILRERARARNLHNALERVLPDMLISEKFL